MYKIRWKIECFNRTTKQLFGFNECQRRSFQAQHIDLLYVLWAYALTDIKRVKFGFKNTEDAIRSYRILKPDKPTCSDYALRENFYAFA